MSAEKFKAAVLSSIAAAKGTYIHDAAVRDLEDKTSPGDPCGYRSWLRGLIGYLADRYGLAETRILDLGCGAGELTVMMNLMGYQATGLEVDERPISLARILAQENSIPAERFMLADGPHLPFPDNSFEIVTMVSCLEHMDDGVLSALVPELRRVCQGVIFVQVPSPMKISDDHTGLRFVTWMPGWLARPYIALRGQKYRYLISQSHRWDVVYRTLRQVQRRFSGLTMDIVPQEHSFPRCGPEHAVLDLQRSVAIGGRKFRVAIPLLHRRLRLALGERIEEFYPYYNVVFRK